jgi:Holliday junction resolvase RusA-like endonuclease
MKAAAVQGWKPLDGPVEVTIVFTFQRASADVDGPTKGVLDAMQGVAYTNDSQIVRLIVSKTKGDYDTRVTVREAP